MNDAWLLPDAATVVIFGGGCALLGLTGLLERPRGRRVQTWTNGLALLFVLGAAGAFTAGLPRAVWATSLTVGAIPLTLTAFGQVWPYLPGTLFVVLSRPRLQGVLLLVAGPLSVLAWVRYVDYYYFGPTGTFSHLPPTEPLPPMRPAAHHARTDRDAALQLWSYASSSEMENVVQRKEEQISQALAVRLIRTAPPSFDTNCHGWVFCDGRFCVEDADVDRILRDNDYRIVSQPQAGDLIVYRAFSDMVIHTGIVRLVQDDRVLVESKWGCLGRYLHEPADQLYGDRWTFYRTSRPSHLLQIEPGALTE
jgi:hypothetical protein